MPFRCGFLTEPTPPSRTPESLASERASARVDSSQKAVSSIMNQRSILCGLNQIVPREIDVLIVQVLV